MEILLTGNVLAGTRSTTLSEGDEVTGATDGVEEAWFMGWARFFAGPANLELIIVIFPQRKNRWLLPRSCAELSNGAEKSNAASRRNWACSTGSVALPKWNQRPLFFGAGLAEGKRGCR